MNNIYQVIRRPVVTEKTSAMKAEANKLVFDVARWANKIEIQQAVERIFSTKVVDVQTANMRGKKKRVGRTVGLRQNWKKAIVTLAEGEDVDVLGQGAEL